MVKASLSTGLRAMGMARMVALLMMTLAKSAFGNAAADDNNDDDQNSDEHAQYWMPTSVVWTGTI